MPVTLKIRDETAAGHVYGVLSLEIPAERMTVRELIRERVYQEVQDFNRRHQEQVFCGLVQPTDAERILQGNRPEYRLKEHREIDWKAQFAKAVEAFERNGFFIVVDDRQAESLEEEFSIHPETQVSFVRLTVLVGG
jgi:hypothetical protein